MTRRRRTCVAIAVAVVVSHLATSDALGDPSRGPILSTVLKPYTTVPAVPLTAPPAPLPPSTGAGAGPGFLHLRSSAHIRTAGGSELDLAPGYYLDDSNWLKFDTEFKRLQNQETRLTAENESMRVATSGWQPGWFTLTMTLLAGVAGGAYLHAKL